MRCSFLKRIIRFIIVKISHIDEPKFECKPIKNKQSRNVCQTRNDHVVVESPKHKGGCSRLIAAYACACVRTLTQSPSPIPPLFSFLEGTHHFDPAFARLAHL